VSRTGIPRGAKLFLKRQLSVCIRRQKRPHPNAVEGEHCKRFTIEVALAYWIIIVDWA
jgi:hypothetical protein